MAYVIGIDLGTTNSVVATLEAGKPLVMQNAEGSKTTPSVVLFRKGDDPIVGEIAKRQRLVAPKHTIHSVKRFVGCRWDESAERREGIEYDLVPGPDSLVAVQFDDMRLLPEQIQAETLKKMKQTAEDYLGETLHQAVITCPAYFNDSQRSATKRAAEMAGLDALRIINEPTAAALAYGLDKQKNQRIAVFDFGGGTFDISILEIDEDVFEVKATCGDTFLGGDVVDNVLADWIVRRLLDEQGLDIRGDVQAMSRVSEVAEKVKCELSTLERTTISLPFIGANETGPKHFNGELTRAAFEELIAPVLDRLKGPCQKALRDARVEPRDLGAVILVGGSTRIPAVQRLVRELFGREPDRSINPDEAVAIGASIQAGIMSGELDEILLLDVTPLSLGIELAGGLFSPLIQRNSNIPTTARKKFTTVRDNQTTVTVHVQQGERRKASENRTLARFRLEGIAPAPREVPEIEVSFTIDANGILNVAAMDLTTGSVQQVTVESYQPVLDGEADRMITEATTMAEDDRTFMRKLGVRQRADDMRQDIDQLKRQTNGEALSEDQERRLTEAFFRLDVALTKADWGKIDEADRELKSVFTEIMMLSGYPMGKNANDEFVFDTSAGPVGRLDDEDPSIAPPMPPGPDTASPASPEPPAAAAEPTEKTGSDG